jgi:hypothetical protein
MAEAKEVESGELYSLIRRKAKKVGKSETRDRGNF